MIAKWKPVFSRLALCLALFISAIPPAAANNPLLHDTGRFRVGSLLGEDRAGFSGRPKVMIFTNPLAADWPAIEACLLDPLLDPTMEFFTGVLINDLDEPDVEAGLRQQGIQVVVRGLNGGIQALLEPGFTCLELVGVLEGARRAFPGEPEKSPIYAVLLDNPETIEQVALDFGCTLAAKFVDLFGEFEGQDSPVVAASKTALALRCSSFLRGDANQDGKANISDAIYTLGFLFLGDPLPVCSDAADSNDDGNVDISDPLYFLGYLFICSTAPPPEPFPLSGPDPTTEDALNCAQADL